MRFAIIALLSLTILGLELIWTRIFSAEFFYSFAFLMLSLAVLGLGLGALTLRLFPFLRHRRCLGLSLALCGGITLAAPPLVFKLQLDFANLLGSWSMVGRLVGAILLLASAYFFGGLALAALLRENCHDTPRLYMADLLGAGIGVVLALILMNCFGTPVATVLMAVPVLLAGLLASRGVFRALPLMLLIATFVVMPRAGRLLTQQREERAPVIYEHWDATAKIKVYEFDAQYRGLNIDNAANSPVLAFDGNWDRPGREPFGFGIDVSNLIGRFDHCKFLSLGAGGGGDVLQALQAGATEVHAVEVIPHINEMMLTGELANFSGRIYEDPRVRVVTGDGRAYVRQHRSSFDVIYALSANSFAALTSGSFALAENYLFTTEALEDYWGSLTPEGFMMIEHQFYMPRIVASLMDALTACQVDQPRAHFAVYDLPRMRRQMVLISKRPLTDEIRNNAFGALTPDNYEDIHLLFPASDELKDNLINRIVQEGWPAVAATAAVNISPCTDDRPYVGQMGRWKNFHWTKPPKLSGMDVLGYPTSQLIMALLLIITIVLIVPLNVAPALCRGPRLGVLAWLYFFAIGVAFMSVEVILLQKYTLFLGPSANSVAAVLLTLLVGAAVGSRVSSKVGSTGAFAGLLAWLLLETFVFQRVMLALPEMSAGARLAVAVLLLFPLGLFMGMPFPLGALRVRELVDWGLAVNGAASVLGATAILLVAMTWGFRTALLSAAAVYALAWLLIARRQGWGLTQGQAEPAATDAEAGAEVRVAAQ